MRKMRETYFLKDHEILAELAANGLIEWPVDSSPTTGRAHNCVDIVETLSRPMGPFVHNGTTYRLTYVDGCFLPYVTYQVEV